MSRLFEELGIGRLSVDERLALVQEIWDRIAELSGGSNFMPRIPNRDRPGKEMVARFRQRRD